MAALLPLERLDLSWCDELRGDAVAALWACCPRLRRVSLRCADLRCSGSAASGGNHDAGVAVGAGSGAAEAQGGATLPASFAAAFGAVRECGMLVELDLGRCEGIDDGVLLHLVKLARLLQDVDIAWCDVSDAGATALLRELPQLRRASLQGCKRLGKSMLGLARDAAELRWLDLSWCNSIDPEDVQTFVNEVRPDMEVVDYYAETVRVAAKLS